MATSTRTPSPTNSALPPIPSSPTYSYASTTLPIPSTFNLPLPPPPRPPHAVLTKSDLESSHHAYATLLTTAKSYRLALASLSISASTFGSALEACARLKEARSESMPPSGVDSMSNSFTAKGGMCTGDTLMAASGVHQLIANHQQILSETVYRSFEVPLLHELDQWERRMEEEEEAYQREAKAMSKEIRKMEKEGLRLHRGRKRDVSKFREHLVQLTGQLDALTGLSGGHSRGLLRDCQEMSQGIVECSAGLVRAEVDIFEALARKGWSGGGLDELLEKGRDLFACEMENGGVDAHPNHAAKIFSILPQGKSILAEHPTEGLQTKLLQHSRSDSLLVEGMNYQSLAGVVSVPRDTDVMSMFSERDVPSSGILNKSRGVRPFSPTPGELIRDPLEDHRPSSASGLNISKTRSRDEEQRKSEDSEESIETTSDTTIVPIHLPAISTAVITPDITSPPEVDEAVQLEEEEDEEALKPDNTHQSPTKRTESEFGGSERRVKERRWSVTDDGVMSE